MATAVLGSSSHKSPWDSIKDERYPSKDHWGSSNGSGWGTSGWDENGGWGSGSRGWGSGTGGWGSGTGKTGEWGSGPGGWGLSGDAWENIESNSSGLRKQPTLTDFWSGSTSGKKSDSPLWKPSSLKRDVEPEFPSSTSRRLQLEDDSSTGWGSTNGGWGTGTGTSIWAGAAGGEIKNVAGTEENAKDCFSPLFSPLFSPKSPERSAWGAYETTSLDTQAQSNFQGRQVKSTDNPVPTSIHLDASASTPQPSSELHEVVQACSFPQSYFTTFGDGSSEYRPYPNTYDIRAMWAANYTGYYCSIDFSASSNAVEESIDRNLERYYWDLRYQSELPNPSPYIQETRNISEKHREFLIGRLAHIDFMFSRVEHKMRPISASKSEFQPSPSKDFLSQHDRDAKKTVYKALRLLYKEWHNGADYPSVLDWEGDHSMPYRVGPMIG